MAKIALPVLILPPPSMEEVLPPPPPASKLICPNQPHPKEDERVRGVSHRLYSGYADTIGVRKNMEDRIVIHGYLRARDDEDFFAVYDGHNGDTAAKYCAGRLHVRLAEVLEKQEKGTGTEEESKWDAKRDFISAFELTNLGLEKVKAAGGTTAVVALFKGADLFIANAGDSRAVLSKNSKAIRVTTDHKPDLPQERARIESNGGWIRNGGITGTLTVSRSLGDFAYKPYISCEPDVFGPFGVTDESNQLVILACDGLWDVVTDDEAVEIALTGVDPEDAALRLREKAVEKKSKDNISVLVVFFPHYKGNEKGEKIVVQNNNVTTAVVVDDEEKKEEEESAVKVKSKKPKNVDNNISNVSNEKREDKKTGKDSPSGGSGKKEKCEKLSSSKSSSTSSKKSHKSSNEKKEEGTASPPSSSSPSKSKKSINGSSKGEKRSTDKRSGEKGSSGEKKKRKEEKKE